MQLRFYNPQLFCNGNKKHSFTRRRDIFPKIISRGGPVRSVPRVATSLSDSQPAQEPSTPFPYGTPEEDTPEECSTSWVQVDQQDNPLYTKIIIDAPHFHGLQRTIAWVMNGCRIVLKHGRINCEDGMAHNEMWVTTEAGQKLPDHEAQILEERLEDFVMYCKPMHLSPSEWAVSGVAVSNNAHPQWTVLTARGNRERPDFYLELVSLITGSGALFHRGKIVGEESIPPQIEQPLASDDSFDATLNGYDFNMGPLYEFYISDEVGNKMDPPRIAAMLYVYDRILGKGHMPYVAPNLDSFLNFNKLPKEF